MATTVKSVPEGYHTVTPFLSEKNAAKAIEFYKNAFGAKLIEKHEMNGKIMHAVIQIGNSYIMLADEFPDSKCGMSSPQSLKGTTTSFHIYVEDADAMFSQAVKAGATVVMPIADAFWGDRYGQITDPFGHVWSIATRKRNLSDEQVNKGAQELMAKAKH